MARLWQRISSALNFASTAQTVGGWLTPILPQGLFVVAAFVLAWLLGQWQHMTLAGALLFALLAGGIALFVVNQAYRIAEWREKRRERNKPRQLYLTITPQGADPDPWKGYYVHWSPTECLPISFSDRAITQDLKPGPPEIALTLYLFNAGPDDVRYMKVQWAIPDFDAVQAVREGGLFADHVVKLDDQHIQLTSGGGSFATRPLANPATTKIPLLKVGETLRITCPEPFTGALAIALLAIQKRIPTQISADLANVNPYDLISATQASIRLEIDVECTTDQGILKQGFDLLGHVRMSSFYRKVAGEDNHYEPVPDGQGANLENLQVQER
jgi:hypothetical protein